MNWIDATVLAFLLFHAYRGWKTGGIYQAIGILSYMGSFFLAVQFETIVGNAIGSVIGLTGFWKPVIGFFVVAIGSDFLIFELIWIGAKRLPRIFLHSAGNTITGIIISILKGVIFGFLLLLVFLVVPLRGSIQSTVRDSISGRYILGFAQTYTPWLVDRIKHEVRKTQQLLTVTTDTTERVDLDIPPVTSMSVSVESETTIVTLINREREVAGVLPLTIDPKLTEVARNHSKEMLQNRFFSHADSSGGFVADRAIKAGIPFDLIGENIAYAGDVESAHIGLMDSPSHKANILESSFTRIGVGIMEHDMYGMMITEVFAD